MKKGFPAFPAIILALLTLGAAVFAWINFRKEQEFAQPYDGVWWVEQEGWLRARRVEPGGPADQGGIKPGDRLSAVNDNTLNTVAGLTRQLYKVGIWNKATYSVVRGPNDIPLDIPVILAPADRSLNAGLRLIALIYLAIGLYVLLRRWTAPGSLHFYVFCLVSFVFYAFKFTGKLNFFDWTVYWCNVVAWLLQPALFLHFSLNFPEPKKLLRGRWWVVGLVYVPAATLLAIHLLTFGYVPASALLLWNLDRVQMVYLVAYFVLAAWFFRSTYTQSRTPILRQQMKLIYWGTVLAIAPFAVFYVLPYLTGALATTTMKVSAFSLVLLPLTFGYAIVRYRLMDVDIIFKRGMTYTLATAAIVGVYFGVVGGVVELLHLRFPSAGPWGMVIAMVLTALLFEPVKKWVQEKVIDPYFYRKRYDHRKTLIEFGRDLSSETDLDKMLTAVVDRLSRTLLVDRVAVFLAEGERGDQFTLAKSYGISYSGPLDLGFLTQGHPELTAGHLFFDNPQQAIRETAAARQTIARLDLSYYIPCIVQERIIAVLGLGKTFEGDFLTSEDVELLEAVAGYVGIAIQNAKLYASLEEKVLEYERLKDFNENIVESISVGVLAVDLDDRIEFWNAQMEVMYAMSRSQALRRPIGEIFPEEFVQEFYRVRENPGIHNLYKFRLNTPAGDTRTANIAIAPLVTRNFQVVGRLIIVDDMTERVELEAQLSQADKLSSIGLLAAGVAHEVNTPLAVISSYAQMLAKQLQGNERQYELLDKITKQTFRASEIVNNLLNFSRTSGTEFSEINLHKIIADTLALLEHQLKISRVKVEQDLAADLPLVHGNAGKLQQVFLNLFLNAKDAMPEGGTLNVATSNGPGVLAVVRDTGAGISPEHLSRIYDPFFTTKTGAANGRRGTGLGLSVTYGILQEHAGKIRVESAPGQGTTFYLEFPMVRKAVKVNV